MKNHRFQLKQEKTQRGYIFDSTEVQIGEESQFRKNRSKKSFASRLRTVVGMIFAAVAMASQAALAADVLILGPTVSGGTSSARPGFITGSTSTPISGLGITGLGLTADIVHGTGINSRVTPPQAYSAYKAIVLGDPNCGSTTAPVAAAIANATEAAVGLRRSKATSSSSALIQAFIPAPRGAAARSCGSHRLHMQLTAFLPMEQELS